MRNNNFISWLGQLLLGLALLIGSMQVMMIFGASWWPIAAGAAVVGVIGLGIIARAELKERPLRVLRKAQKALTFPTQWAVKFDKSLPQGGAIPIAVIRSDGVRFVIDIQEHKDCEWNDPLEGESLLIGPRGKKFKTDPTGPLMKAATAWGATAVLWLPEATNVRNLRQDGCNLMVVMGTARDLQHALRGAEIVPYRMEEPTRETSKSTKQEAAPLHSTASTAPQLTA